MLVASAMVEGQPAVARRDLHHVLQRRVGTDRSGPGAQSVMHKMNGCCLCCDRVRELEAEVKIEHGLRETTYLQLKKTEARVAELTFERDYWKMGIETNPDVIRRKAMPELEAALEAFKQARESKGED
jgi:hypothetical protein